MLRKDNILNYSLLEYELEHFFTNAVKKRLY